MGARFQIYENWRADSMGAVWEVIEVNLGGNRADYVSMHTTMRDAADEANRLNKEQGEIAEGGTRIDQTQ